MLAKTRDNLRGTCRQTGFRVFLNTVAFVAIANLRSAMVNISFGTFKIRLNLENSCQTDDVHRQNRLP